jgi:phosphatidylglycerophosphate synthase
MSSRKTARALILAGEARAMAASARYLGLTVIERVVRNLRARGVSELTVSGRAELLPAELHVGVTFVAHASEGEAITRAAAEAAEHGQALLVLPADVVFHPQLAPRLLERLEGLSGQRPQLAICGEANETAALAIGPGALGAEQLPEEPLARVVAQLASHELLTRVELVERWSKDKRDALFVVPARGAQSLARAGKLLMKLNWRPHDGIIAGLLNKHISVPISRVVVASSFITPNVMTAVAFVIALCGIGLTAVGSYWSFFIGAGLVQIQSILDGCDGEIARLRYLSSRFGAWFDTVVDDLIGILWIVAVGIGMYRMTGQWIWLAICFGSTALYTVALSLVYYTLIRGKAQSHSDFVWFFDEGRDPHSDYPDLTKFSTWATYVVRRDFYVLAFFLFAAANLMIVVAIVSSLAATAWFVVGMIHVKKRGLRLPEAH